jgi:hypothetical protein
MAVVLLLATTADDELVAARLAELASIVAVGLVACSLPCVDLDWRRPRQPIEQLSESSRRERSGGFPFDGVGIGVGWLVKLKLPDCGITLARR